MLSALREVPQCCLHYERFHNVVCITRGSTMLSALREVPLYLGQDFVASVCVPLMLCLAISPFSLRLWVGVAGQCVCIVCELDYNFALLCTRHSDLCV